MILEFLLQTTGRFGVPFVFAELELAIVVNPIKLVKAAGSRQSTRTCSRSGSSLDSS
jgi:hypothetical protein